VQPASAASMQTGHTYRSVRCCARTGGQSSRGHSY
jgi:hypothetical protein